MTRRSLQHFLFTFLEIPELADQHISWTVRDINNIKGGEKLKHTSFLKQGVHKYRSQVSEMVHHPQEIYHYLLLPLSLNFLISF